MANSILDIVRRAIRQQTVSVGSVVSNLTGASVGELGAAGLSAKQQWAYASVPGTQLPELAEFYAQWQSHEAPQVQILEPATDTAGAVYFMDSVPAVHLVAGGIVVAGGQLQFELGIEAGPQSQFAIYVDGVLLRRGNVALQQLITLPEGRHSVELLFFTPSALITVPPTIAIVADALFVPVPQWSELVTDMADPITGSTMNRARFVNDARVGGVRLLRRTSRPLALISAVSALTQDRIYSVTFDGNVLSPDGVERFSIGEELFCQNIFLGYVVRVDVSSGSTVVVLRMAPDQEPQIESITGLMGYVGAWREVARSGRTVVGGVTELQDRDVILAERYDYCLQAWSLFNASVWSSYSEALSVRAGDTDAPGCFTLRGTPTLRNGVLTIGFHTPSDSDYAGVNVYTSLTRYVRLVSGNPGTLIFEPSTGLTYEDGTFDDWIVTFGEFAKYKVISHTGTTLILDDQNSQVPQPGDLLTLSKRTKLVTDLGLPDTDDAITIAAPTELTTFEFRTFDRSRNEQTDLDLEECPNAFWVFDPEEYGRPQVYVTELNGEEQSLFTGAVANPEDYTIILIGAANAAGDTTGVEIFYRINDGATESFAASTAPAFSEPTGATVGVRPWVDAPYQARPANTRYLALPRTIDITYVQIWAVDGDGVESRIFYFATSAPYVALPTIELITEETESEAILRLRITDPKSRVAHTPLRDPTPTIWSGVQFAVQYGLDCFTPYSNTEPPVDVGDPGDMVREYTKTVGWPAGTQTVRIAYRVTAVQPNGEVDQIAQGIIPYTKGSSPGYPIITSTFDADGTLQLQLQGDSNTGSMQFILFDQVRRDVNGLLEAQRTVGGPWQPLPTRAELADLFAERLNTNEVDGRFAEYDTQVQVQGLAWVAARSASRSLTDTTWPGEVTRNNLGEEDFTTKLFSQADVYIPPKISESFTEFLDAGVPKCRVTITLSDPQSRVRRGNGVVFRRMPGTDTTTWDPEPIAGWYQPPEQAGASSESFFYSATVDLIEGQASRVAYAVIGEDERGIDNVVLEQRLVLCGIGSRPMIPSIVGVVDASGDFALILTGDSDTVSFKFALDTAAPADPEAFPLVADVRTQTSYNGRLVRTNTLATLGAEDVVYVTVLAYNRDGVESEAGYYKAARGEIYIRPEIEELTDETTDTVNGVDVAYGVLQLRVRDPQDRITLVEFSGMSGNNPSDWDREFDGTNYVVQWNAPTSVEVIEPGVEQYVYQVPLAPDHLSRIMYRVKGTRPDASEGILQSGTVTFDIGATPNILFVGGHIDSLGQYWPTFSGDTDARSWILAARVGEASDSAASYPTITEVKNPLYPNRQVYTGTGAGLRQYPDPDGTPAPDVLRNSDGDPIIVPVGKMLFVTAMAFATLTGGALQQEYQSNVYRYSVLRSLAYSPPQVEVDPSETGTTATLTLTVRDPQDLMSVAGAGVFFRRMVGRASNWESAYIPVAASGGNATAGFEYVSNANLTAEGTKIGYQVKALQPDGTVGLATSGVVAFNLSANPEAPIVQTTLDATGTLRALVYGDSDATHVKVVFSKTAMPSATDVNGAVAVALTNGQALITYSATVLTSETVYIAARALNQAVPDTSPSAVTEVTVYGSDVYVRPTVRESVSETNDTGFLTLTLSDPQQRLREITFKRQSGTAAFESTTVSVYPTPPVANQVQHSVQLMAQKTSRIQYELYGIREDGSNGLLGVNTITYRIGPNPSSPKVSALCSPNGAVTVYISGDSDTLGARVAARKGDVRMTKADVIGPNPTGVARTAVGGSRELTWTIPLGDLTLDPGEKVSVGVIAYSDAACLGFESDVATFVEARESLYISPSVTAIPSETDTVGTLTIQAVDKQLRVASIEVQTKSGRNTASPWTSVYTRGVSTSQSINTTATVTLAEDVSSTISYRVVGTLADGTMGTILSETVPFAIGRIPVAPIITLDVASDGAVRGTFIGDSDTQSFRYGTAVIASTASAASIETEVANLVLSNTASGRSARIASLGTASGTNALLVVAQAASGASGLGQLSTARAYAIAQPSASISGVSITLAKITALTNTTMTITVTCSDGGQVRLTSIQNATLTTGAALNTWVASGSQWTFTRNTTLPGTAEFQGGNVTGVANSGDSVYLPAQSEAVKPPLTVTARVTSSNSSTGTITYGFTINDPGSTGLTFRLQLAGEGLPGFTPVLTNLSAGSEYTITVTQPAIGASPGLLRATASHTGNAVYPDVATVTVPALGGGLQGVVTTEAQITQINATNVWVTATASMGQIRLASQTGGTEVIGGGTAAGVWAGTSSASWVFARLASSAGTAVFEGGNLAGYGNTRDVVYIPSQLEAVKIPLRITTILSSTNPTTGQMVYSLGVLDSTGNLVNATVNVSASAGVTVSNSSLNTSSGGYVSLTITMPAAGGGTGQVQLTAGAGSNYYPDTAILIIPARGTVPLPTFTEVTSENGTDNTGTLTLQSFDPYTQISSVQMRTRSGDAAPESWGAWTTATGSTVSAGRLSYTASTTMGAKRPGAIEWRAYLSADTSQPFTGGTTRFAPGRIPAAPEIYLSCNEDGSFNVSLIGDSDTSSFRFGYMLSSSSTYPTPGTTYALSTGTTTRITNLPFANFIPLGGTVYVSAQGVNSSGVAGPIAYSFVSRDNEPVTGKRITVAAGDFGSVADVYFDATSGFLTTGTIGRAWASVPIPLNAVVTRVGITYQGGNGGGAYLNSGVYSSSGALLFSIPSLSTFSGFAVDDVTSSFSYTASSTGSQVRFEVFLQGNGAKLYQVWVEYNAPKLSNSL